MFVSADHADVTQLDSRLRTKLALDGKRHLIGARGKELGVEHPGFAKRGVAADAGEVGLLENLIDTRQRRPVAVDADAEGVGGVDAGGTETTAVARAADARDGLPDARSLERHLHDVDAVDPAVDARVAATNDGGFLEERGLPRHGDAGAEDVVDGIEGILASGSYVADGGESNDRLIHFAGEGGFLALTEIVGRGEGIAIAIDNHGLVAVGLVRRHLRLPPQAINQGE